MLDLKLLSRELSEHKDDIIDYESDDPSIRQAYLDKFPALDSMGVEANAQLPRYSGCKVLEEGPFIRRFGEHFGSRANATDWALKVLKGRAIAAIDGSQVYASREISVPIGLAQAYLVLNRHLPGGNYETISDLSLVVPSDFEEWGGAYAYARAPIDLKRHGLECRLAERYLRSGSGSTVFIDGSLVMSFINQVEESKRLKYADGIMAMLDASESQQFPVAAYTDMSMSKDIVTMMGLYFRLRRTRSMTDVHLLAGKMAWGDRTRVFLSDRDDRDFKTKVSVLDLYGKHRDGIAFFYIQSGGGLASKVEVPLWCYKAGLIDDIADLVRAECIVRPGYPDIIHRAHEHAKISMSEGRIFDEMLNSFARQHNVKIHRSAKEFYKGS